MVLGKQTRPQDVTTFTVLLQIIESNTCVVFISVTAVKQINFFNYINWMH